MVLQNIQKKLSDWDRQGLRRRLREIQSPQGRVIRHGDRDYLNFSSNNYLGLAEDPRLQEAFAKGMGEYGLGSGAARLVNGSLSPFHRLEEALARFKGTQGALLFNSGYQANVGALSCLVGEGDFVFSDELNHASLIDGIRLSKAHKIVFPHNGLDELKAGFQAARKKARPGATFLVATESVFSMEGDLCPLRELMDRVREEGALLYLDEAHATGVFGEGGSGRAEEYRDHPAFAEHLIQLGTLGKALGCFGAYVAAPSVIIDYLINRARTFIYSTALPPGLATAVMESLRILKEQAYRRDVLWRRMELLEEEMSKAFPQGSLKVHSPIVSVNLGSPVLALELSDYLLERGLWVSAIRPPTVPEGTSRLRITLMATHTEEDVRYLVKTLKEGIEEHGSWKNKSA